MTNQTQPTKTNSCFIGVDVLPRLKQREEHLRKMKQARRLYYWHILYMVMFAIFGMFTALGVLGGIQMASLGLHNIATTFLFVGIGSAILMIGAVWKLREIAERSWALLSVNEQTQAVVNLKIVG